MNDQTKNSLPQFSFDAIADTTRASFETLSDTYSTWLKSANRMQAEAIRFLGDRFNKDLQLLARVTRCNDPGEVLKVQTEAATQLVNDYLEEGTRWIALLGDGAPAKTKERANGR